MKNSKNNHNTWLDDVASKDISIQHGAIRVANESKAEKKKHWLRNRTNFFILMAIMVTIVGWFTAGIFLSRVSFGGSVTSAPRSDVLLQKIIEQRASTYKLAITYPDGSTKSFSLTKMGLKADSSTTVGNIRKNQHKLFNRLKWWQPIKVNLTLESNESLRDSFIAKHTTVTIQPPTDATISIKNGEVVLTNATPGKLSGLVGPIDTINAAVSTMQTTPLKLQTLSKRPAITSRQLLPYQEKLRSMLNQSVTFVIDSNTFKATTTDIADWIELSPSENGRKIDIAVNSGKVLAYITKISGPFVTLSKTQVEVTRDDGTTAILSKGVTGSDIINKSVIASDVAKDLLNNKATDKILSVKYADFKTVGANTYDKWIEVDLTNKKLYAYEQSTLIKTFLISAGAPATPTVTGQYAIYSKIAQQDMRGSNVDGSSYFQPKVAWVNYFYGSYAIHGNYWRPLSWFGNFNSSHGCVGLPDSEAQWVYSWAPVGTQVFIHV